LKQVTISNEFITLIVLDYGATIQKLLVKGKDGKYTNVVVGYNHPSRYRLDENCLGSCVGRFIKLSYVSKHLEEGYPGNLTVNVTYKLVNNALQIVHEAITDRSTVVNLTNHSYFKLDDSPYVDNNELQLNCPIVLEMDDRLLPTGNQIPVRGTEKDFLLPREIGVQRLDTPFVKDMGSEKVAELFSPKSGISMKVYTNQPAVIVFTPLDFPGICFETQNYPDAPNQPDFPNSVLRPGEIYNNIAIYKFDLVP